MRVRVGAKINPTDALMADRRGADGRGGGPAARHMAASRVLDSTDGDRARVRGTAAALHRPPRSSSAPVVCVMLAS